MSVYDIAPMGELLRKNSYPGRGIVLGKSADGKSAVFAYFIMGRSENSRNRVFSEREEMLTIYPFDESKVEDPSLIIYSPIRRVWDKWIITNGDQTDTIFDSLVAGQSFESALEKRCFEPDVPNFTPRISGLIDLTDGGFAYKLSILKSADVCGSACNRFFFSYRPIDGLGHFIHTYDRDGSPIPSFTGEPERVAVASDIDEFSNEIWNNLHPENKVALYVSYVDLCSGNRASRIFNKHQRTL